MAALDLFKLSFLISALFSGSDPAGSPPGNNAAGVRVFPPTCSRIECPSYDIVHAGDGFEIRRYDSSMWVSTQPIEDVSLVNAGSIGFLQLFAYIQGKNENNEKIEMTAPVLTEVKPSNGPFCASSFVISFYVPKQNQATAPSAEGLSLRKWGPIYVAVRQFSGFAKTDDIGQEAAALYASLVGTTWLEKINNNATSEYIVAQYNSPFEFKNRVNEIWFTFDLDNESIVV
ncbi:SOUL heme-binding family protein [Striga asiatica]|uniref:SOUL heme-binding family protein n=1 Tax=Striga asiatica TaxID=4170 RepID=A0A5A7R905_STRAF|nr:SOUL heme-binding family protein [Striga asiatica]